MERVGLAAVSLVGAGLKPAPTCIWLAGRCGGQSTFARRKGTRSPRDRHKNAGVCPGRRGGRVSRDRAEKCAKQSTYGYDAAEGRMARVVGLPVCRPSLPGHTPLTAFAPLSPGERGR